MRVACALYPSIKSFVVLESLTYMATYNVYPNVVGKVWAVYFLLQGE